MMNDYERLSELQDAAMNSAGSSAEQFDKTLESLQSKMQRLNNAWTEFTMGIANNELIKSVVDIITNIISGVDNILSKLDGIPKMLASIGVIIVGFNLAKLFVETVILPIAASIKAESLKMAQNLQTQMQQAGANSGKAFATGFKIQTQNAMKNFGNKFVSYFADSNGFMGQTVNVAINNSKENLIKELSKIQKYTGTQIGENKDDYKKILQNNDKVYQADLKAQGLDNLPNEVELAIPSFKNLGAAISGVGLVMTTVLNPAILKTMKIFGASDEEIDKWSKGLNEATTIIMGVGMALPIIGKGIQIIAISVAKSRIGLKLFATNAVAAGAAVQAAFWEITLIAAAVVAAIGAIIAIINEIHKNSPEGKIEAAQEELSKLNEELEKTSDNIQKLEDGIDKFRQLKDELKDLVKGSKEWNDKILEINDNILSQAEIGNLWGDITVDENGMLSLSEDKILEALAQEQNNKQQEQNDILKQQLIIAEQELEIAKRNEDKAKGEENQKKASAEVTKAKANVDAQTLNVVKNVTKDMWVDQSSEERNLRQLALAKSKGGITYSLFKNIDQEYLKNVNGWQLTFTEEGKKLYNDISTIYQEIYGFKMSSTAFLGAFAKFTEYYNTLETTISEMSVAELKYNYDKLSLTKGEASTLSREQRKDIWGEITSGIALDYNINATYLRLIGEKFGNNVTGTMVEGIAKGISAGVSENFYTQLANSILPEDVKAALVETGDNSYYSMLKVIDSFTTLDKAEREAAMDILDTSHLIYDVPFDYIQTKLNNFSNAVDALADALDNGTSVFDEETKEKLIMGGANKDNFVRTSEGYVYIGDINELDKQLKGDFIKTIAGYDEKSSSKEITNSLNNLFNTTDLFDENGQMGEDNEKIWQELQKLAKDSAYMTEDAYLEALKGILGEGKEKIFGGIDFANYDAEGFAQKVQQITGDINSLIRASDEEIQHNKELANSYKDISLLLGEIDGKDEDNIKTLKALANQYGVAQAEVEALNKAEGDLSDAENQELVASIANQIAIARWTETNKKRIKSLKELYDTTEDITKLGGTEKVNFMDQLGLDFTNAKDVEFFTKNTSLINSIFANDENSESAFNEFMTNYKNYLSEIYDDSTILAQKMVETGLFYIGEGAATADSLIVSQANETSLEIEKAIANSTEKLTGQWSQIFGVDFLTFLGASDSKISKSSTSTKEKDWENKFDRLYNLLEKINDNIRARDKLQRQYEYMLKKDQASYTIQGIENYTVSDLVSQRELINKENGRLLNGYIAEYQGRISEITDVLDKAKYNGKYYTYDSKNNSINIDWSKINKIKDADLGEAVEKEINTLENIRDNIDDAEDKYFDQADLIVQNWEEAREATMNLEQRVYDALVNAQQKQIDEMSSINDTIGDQNSKLISKMQKAISNSRQSRENQKTEQDIADKEARLAYLQLDTTGVNQQEILDLQKQLDDARQDYTDNLIDQKISELEDQNDFAQEQREREINILQSQLNYNKETGAYWPKVYELMEVQNGRLINAEQLTTLLKENENFQGLSKLAQADWATQLKDALSFTIIYDKEKDAFEVKSEDNTNPLNIIESEAKGEGIKNKEAQGYDAESTKNKSPGGSTGTSVNTQDKLNKADVISLLSDQPKGAYVDIKNNINSRENSITLDSDKYYGKFVESIPFHGQEYYAFRPKGESEIYFVSAKEANITDAGYLHVPKGTYPNGPELYDNDRKNARKSISSKYSTLKESTHKYTDNYVAYATGGLNTSTGPAWLDGTYSKPELVLNAQDTKNFIALKDVLSDIMKGAAINDATAQNVDVDIDINVNELSNDYDVEKLINKVKSEITKASTYRNNTMVSLK